MADKAISFLGLPIFLDRIFKGLSLGEAAFSDRIRIGARLLSVHKNGLLVMTDIL